MSFRVDLHVHTLHSGDNGADPGEVVEEAIARGLDGIAFTEHYSYEASGFVDELRVRYGGDILLLRGVEFSAAEGHCLVYGVNTDRLGLRGAPVGDLIRVVNEQGGVAIPSHPYRRGSGIGDLVRDLAGIHALEGCNGCNLHAMNVAAIEVAKSIGLPVTGGSDAHLPPEVGGCYTEFDAPVTEGNFLDMLRGGSYRGRDVRKISLMAPSPAR
jgi:predicted metal-dependent phosphoesterase TrpH